MSLNLFDLIVWAIVGVVAGWVASRVMLGHGLGLVGDLVVGVIGAVVGNLLANSLGMQIPIGGHPVVSQTLVAILGALVLCLALRLVGLGRRRHFR
jgi:uncharacterized membrane protein YeaQ/YmgE (transglycosylase-associated protein family)